MEYREVISAPIWLIAFVYFIFLSVVLSIWAALGDVPALLTFVALTIALAVIYQKTKLVIEIDSEELRVGPARIERKYIGQCENLEAPALKLVRGRDADPAAYLGIRFWQPTGIKMHVLDSRDSTPYWLITSKRGQEMTALLNK
jgi:hypothetical protein